MDLNHEIGGLNRRPGESISDYWIRLNSDNDFINNKKDYCFPDLHLTSIQCKNAAYKTSEHTYYFAISSGEKKVNFCEKSEIFNEPKFSIKLSLGFDSDLV